MSNLLELVKESLNLLKQKESIKKVEEINKKDTKALNDLAKGVWILLNQKYVKINDDFNRYLNEKREDFSYLSHLELATVDKNTLEDIVKTFEGTNRQYIDKNLTQIGKFTKLLSEFKNFEEEILKNVDPVLRAEIEQKSASSHHNVVYHLEEIEYLEPLAKGFIARATKDNSMEF